MKKIFLIFISIISTLLVFFAVACTTGGEQEDTGYTVTLDKQSITLIAFDRYELTAVVRDAQNGEVDKPVIWQSADEGVAKVSNGIIFATGAGMTEVSATLEQGATAKCTVTVTDSGVIPELRLNTKTLSVGKGQKFTIISQVFFNGIDCTESDTVFTYTSANGGMASVSPEGIVTATAVGNTQITVYALWRGMGGPDKTGDESSIVALTQTIDVKVIDL